MSHIRIIGYSADDEPIREIKKFVQKTKAENRKQKQDRLFTKSEPLDLDEWFVYLVDGEKWYYKVAQDDTFFKFHPNAMFLGIARPNSPIHRNGLQSHIIESKRTDNKVIKKQVELSPMDGKKCCYCEVQLTHVPKHNTLLKMPPTTRTMDHVIPKHRGGKILKHCCYACNQEKGGLMLHSYIQMLCLLQNDQKPGSKEYLLTQTKIDNANKIAIEINKF